MNKKMVYYLSASILFLIVTFVISYNYLEFMEYDKVVSPNKNSHMSDQAVSESIEEFFDRTECKESTDGCFVCTRSDLGEISCSTAGFACIQKELVCKSK